MKSAIDSVGTYLFDLDIYLDQPTQQRLKTKEQILEEKLKSALSFDMSNDGVNYDSAGGLVVLPSVASTIGSMKG